MSQPVRFRRGESVRNARPKLNELGRQVARLRSAQANVLDVTPSNGSSYVEASVDNYGVTSETVPFTNATGVTTATATVTRLLYTTIAFPANTFGNHPAVNVTVPWPDLGAT